MTRNWFIGWSACVGALWVVLAGVFADDPQCSGFICLTFGDVLVILFTPAVIMWAIGLLVLYVGFRVRSRISSRRHAHHEPE